MTFYRMHHVVPLPSLPVIPGQAQMTITFVVWLLFHGNLTSITFLDGCDLCTGLSAQDVRGRGKTPIWPTGIRQEVFARYSR